MATKAMVDAGRLEKLGAGRLAALLMELAAADPALKRRLRLELAAETAPKKLAAVVRKRLDQIGRARGFVEGRAVRDLAADLDLQRRTIAERIVAVDAAEALELMWRLLDLAEPVHMRCHDSNGTIGGVLGAACDDLGPLALAARADPLTLADRAFDALCASDHGQFDGLIAVVAPALGRAGLAHLRERFLALEQGPAVVPSESEREVIGWGPQGKIYRDDIHGGFLKSVARLALQEIADADGDPDAFIATFDLETRKVPGIAADIADRLLAAGRAEEALATLDAADTGRRAWSDPDWEDTRIAALDALGRGEEAQAARWSCFERTLWADQLRAYLKRLSGFDDVEAEDRALDHVERHRGTLHALAFLVSWPALDRAARFVVARAAELDGNRYEILAPAADALAGRHPLAATIALRAMIDDTLAKGRSSRYGHAARHLAECASLAAAIRDFGGLDAHDVYVARLESVHGRKYGFWSLVG